MPSNHVLINNSIECIVVDSKMDNLLLWLKENAQTTNTGLKKEPDEIAAEAISCSQS